MKGYTVFNVEQIDGLPEDYYQRPEIQLTPVERNARAEAFFHNTGAEIRTRGDRAFYACDGDYIQVPVIEAFCDAESFYATLAHEATHWTRHPDRLNRDLGRKHYGDEGYAREELVAELGAAFLCAELELTPEVREDHAAYMTCWLQVLKNDKRAIFRAAAHAPRAVDYLCARQEPGPERAVPGAIPVLPRYLLSRQLCRRLDQSYPSHEHRQRAAKGAGKPMSHQLGAGRGPAVGQQVIKLPNRALPNAR
ncbi:MAG TPA: zincin-like metallopeptidase domain-containing protein, partial [Candidatus Acidoferrales bacterium]|nr:zincin-like metallopeptidase domain-containing protein [Candidatus Acidoferrales bacterium]